MWLYRDVILWLRKLKTLDEMVNEGEEFEEAYNKDIKE